jgi:hypothetical protein
MVSSNASLWAVLRIPPKTVDNNNNNVHQDTLLNAVHCQTTSSSNGSIDKLNEFNRNKHKLNGLGHSYKVSSLELQMLPTMPCFQLHMLTPWPCGMSPLSPQSHCQFQNTCLESSILMPITPSTSHSWIFLIFLKLFTLTCVHIVPNISNNVIFLEHWIIFIKSDWTTFFMCYLLLINIKEPFNNNFRICSTIF